MWLIKAGACLVEVVTYTGVTVISYDKGMTQTSEPPPPAS